MSKNIYIIADNIFSPLGENTAANFANVKKGLSGVKIHHSPDLSEAPVAAALFDKDRAILADAGVYTKFEQLLIASVKATLAGTIVDPKNPETGLVISTTKGNISLLETESRSPGLYQRISLNTSAQYVANHFGFTANPVIVSNACISGVMAILTASRLIKSGVYKTVVVTGADVVSKFIVSGFQSFQALSQEQCKPFDKDRTGLNLGEASATVILSGDEKYAGNIRVTGGAISDDANHISGPSRTGLELGYAITKAMLQAEVNIADIGMIAAHGTATPYNDDMEAKAIVHAGLAQVPLVATKGFYGHPLGAAGLLESVLTAESIRNGFLPATLGFYEMGTTPVNVNVENRPAIINHALKTASGFGGCNAALILSK